MKAYTVSVPLSFLHFPLFAFLHLPSPPLPLPIAVSIPLGGLGSAVKAPPAAADAFSRIYGSQNTPRVSIFEIPPPPNISYEAKCVTLL